MQTIKNQTPDVLQEKRIFSPSDLDYLPLEVAPAFNIIFYTTVIYCSLDLQCTLHSFCIKDLLMILSKYREMAEPSGDYGPQELA